MKTDMHTHTHLGRTLDEASNVADFEPRVHDTLGLVFLN